MSGMDRYADIIGLPHPEPDPLRHPRMSRENRAAQFAPFAALTGYGDVILEQDRLTDARRILTEEESLALAEELREILEERRSERVEIEYFVPDDRKEGGAYVVAAGVIKRADPLESVLVLTDGTRIPMPDIVEIRRAEEEMS